MYCTETGEAKFKLSNFHVTVWLVGGYQALNTPRFLALFKNLYSALIESNTYIPVILTDSERNILSHKNLDSLKVEEEKYMQRHLAGFDCNKKVLILNFEILKIDFTHPSLTLKAC